MLPGILIPCFLSNRKLRCNVVVIDKNCFAILASAPAPAVRFFIIDHLGWEEYGHLLVL